MCNFVELSDEDVCRLASQGDSTAEAELVSRYSTLVKACSRPYFLTGGDSEDLIQEGMIGLIRAIRQFDAAKGVSFRTYAEHCIHNRVISAIRASQRNKHQPLNDYIPLESPSFDESRSDALGIIRDPEELLISKERLEELASSMSVSLSKFETAVLSLFLDGLSYASIAELVGKSVKSVDNAVQRIRKKLSRHQ